VADWATISALATAGGTLVLAAATFSSVRSANRAARVAERALDLGLRPLLMPSRLEDTMQKIRWVDDHMAHVEGGRGSVEVVDDNIYLAMSVRNAGTGVAVLEAWHVDPEFQHAARPMTDPESFRALTRDLYIPSGDVGFWQGAIRDANDEQYAPLRDAIEQRHPFTVDVLYGDHESGQRAVSRFTLNPSQQGSQWLCSVVRHWSLGRAT